ncbi:MAG TPA: prephenate dehydrogenase/arogenate dehydrogenase family protein [Thermoanaerobaculia bacterium]|nr:prephenate dehydrogenase/arogenate dehydrogenase family protein [Thermoanaerobaculia bacterium]
MHVVIAGLGLIGGSLGKALRRRGWRVGFADPAVSLDEARAAGAADEKVDNLAGDLLVLATPANVAIEILGSLRGADQMVTSVASAMAPLRSAAADVNFVAGHPFAGSELRGLGAAREDLFAGRPWFVDRDDPAVRSMIEAAGGDPILVDAEEHDRIMAMTSHLPQVVATALASMLDGIDPRFVGTGARSMLRLAGSSHEVWQPILEQNETGISAAAEELWRTMQRIGPEEFAKAQRFYRAVIGASSGRPER